MRLAVEVHGIEADLVTLEVGRSATVGEVKALLETREGFPEELQQLSHQGTLLEPERALSSYGVQDASRLSLTMIADGRLWVRVRVSERERRVFTLSAEACDTVDSLKAQLQGKVGLLPRCQRLLLSGEPLQDGSAVLAECGVRDWCCLSLQLCKPLEIRVTDRRGRELRLPVSASYTVAEVKAQLQDLQELPREAQRLLLGGKQLDDAQTLERCGVRDGCNKLYLMPCAPIVRALAVAPSGLAPLGVGLAGMREQGEASLGGGPAGRSAPFGSGGGLGKESCTTEDTRGSTDDELGSDSSDPTGTPT